MDFENDPYESWCKKCKCSDGTFIESGKNESKIA